MPVIQAVTDYAGLSGVVPRAVYIKTNDLQAAILATGYLNKYIQQVGQVFSNEQMALVETTDNGVTLGWYQISIVGANTSLIVASSGSVVLPVVDHHIATFDGTAGAIADQTGTAIQKGSLQAGLSGTAGSLISFPASAASGSLLISAVANVGNKTTTISSVAGLGQNQVLTIPDVGAATGNFILSGSGGTQNITSGALQVNAGVISSGISTGGTAGGFIAYPATASNGSIRVVPVGNAGNFAVTVSPVSTQGQASVITIPDPGVATANFLLDTSAAGQSSSVSTVSATPGTVRAFKGVISSSASPMTSGNLVGVRGEVDCVSASGGFLYGVQGKVIPTGTLSGSVWAPAVFGQYDLSAATIDGGQIAAIWGDMGATGGTFTDVSGARMFAGTNTVVGLTLNSMIYLYGQASNLLELSGSGSTYIAAAGGVTPSGTNKTIKITIDGVDYYILASTVYS